VIAAVELLTGGIAIIPRPDLHRLQVQLVDLGETNTALAAADRPKFARVPFREYSPSTTAQTYSYTASGRPVPTPARHRALSSTCCGRLLAVAKHPSTQLTGQPW
jgi:hypothetical protein